MFNAQRSAFGLAGRSSGQGDRKRETPEETTAETPITYSNGKTRVSTAGSTWVQPRNGDDVYTKYLTHPFATEAAFLGILMLFNLLGEFQRASGMTGYRQPATLRAQVFLCGAILGRAGHQSVLHLSAAWGGLEQRNSLFDKILQYEFPTSPKLQFQPLAGG